ncbi:putative alanine racemase-domain-containing protein [Cyathus striatus]|nr:putative alanine racemase-domain-containing protein [Cyathus striatus]
MVSSLLADALRDPSSALHTLYLESESSLSHSNFPAAVTRHFSSVFASDHAFSQIPTLSPSSPPDSFKDRDLVAFHAMIQDTSLSPEMYITTSCGGWGSIADHQYDPFEYSSLAECVVVWAVSIPGQSSWTNDAQNSVNPVFANHPESLSHKFPILNAPHVALQLKIYDPAISEPLRSTDLHTFVGILSKEPPSIESIPLLNVPTLHVLFSRPIPFTIVPRAFPMPLLDVRKVRQDLISWVATEALAGDTLAAEWVLLAAIGKVQSRTPSIFPPSLTISNFSASASTPALYYVLSQIFPLLTLLPLSLNTLNTAPFVPESKNDDLHSGWLQLPAGSLCLLTEGGITEGTLGEKALLNFRAIQDIISLQRLDYVFPFSSFGFDTDINFVILTDGHKSGLFQTSINMPLRPVHSDSNLYKSEIEINLPSPAQLDLFRQVVGGAKIGNVSVSDKVATYVQDDFVKERKDISSSNVVTTEDLINRMMTARLLALSLHEREVSIEIWEQAKKLDFARKFRLIP